MVFNQLYLSISQVLHQFGGRCFSSVIRCHRQQRPTSAAPHIFEKSWALLGPRIAPNKRLPEVWLLYVSHLTLNDDIYKAMEFVQVSIISYKLYINCYMLVVIADQHLASLACPIIRRFLPTSPYSLGGPVQSM